MGCLAVALPIHAHARPHTLFRVRSFPVLGAGGKPLHDVLITVDDHMAKPEPARVTARRRGVSGLAQSQDAIAVSPSRINVGGAPRKTPNSLPYGQSLRRTSIAASFQTALELYSMVRFP